MSYNKMMKWQRTHRKGTKQPCLMHTGSGFWPSSSFLDRYFKYRGNCEAMGIKPAECEEYYRNSRDYDEQLRNSKVI